MRIDMLGGLRVESGGQVVTPTAPKVRTLLTLFTLHAGEVIPAKVLMRELWPERPPRSAQSTLQTYICHLRRLARTDTDVSVVTSSSGYSLHIPAGRVDTTRFEDLVGRGTRALDDGVPELASTELQHALKLWRGPMLADVPTGPMLDTHVLRFSERKLHALSMRIDADLRLARHASLIGELGALIAEHPLHEGFHIQLMIALFRTGRRSEALAVFHRLRITLAEHLGLDPSAEAERVHQMILMADDELGVPDSAAVQIGPRVPAHLPPDLGALVGRARELDTVVRHLGIDARVGSGPVAVLVTGMAGVGKTAVGLRAAHQVRGRYPDGQLVAELRIGGRPVETGMILEGFLRALGCTDPMPRSTAQRINMFRSWTAARSVLVVLDDAYSAEQVRALSPTGSESGLIVTSRRRLSELGGVHRINLEVLSVDSALELLAMLVGKARVIAEEPAARAVVQLCGGLPLALTAVGALWENWPGLSLEYLTELLADESNRLNLLRYGESDVGAAISASLTMLGETELRVFEAVRTGARTATTVCCALQLPRRETEAAIGRLANEQLVECRYGGAGDLRLSMHPVVRLCVAQPHPRPRLEVC
ncbi:BTAD domain-containing putative transcriptional regulator [Nocardia sp. NPDC056100]|uniref:AfsR/SARP family transcriptional regulator n=1 Tax=Nocardia sp. NPDC056100 TaxID=3345712 RepID=UPI0035E036FA